MPRYKLTIEYDGSPYAGWQKQQERPSVQAAIEEAVFKFCGNRVEVAGAGRTDAGVHAMAQAAHVDLPEAIDPFRIMQGTNFHLFSMEGNRIAITSAEPVPDDFHARFSATKRHYLYRIINRRSRLALEAGRAWHVIEPLDENAMRQAAEMLLGHHDFTSFRDSECQAKSPMKTLDQLDIRRQGNEIHIVTSARSFLHHQVRIMVGTLSLTGKGKWQPKDIKAALEARDRAKAGPTAPPEGLYLVGVEY
ncbi:MAG: tRNA pseudouridine(38-40) synthase TruA [Pseudomonadota bacterium]|nr:tRNA pseudouridine(38-40) synthase TruA [Pseudomonadota bacterium]